MKYKKYLAGGLLMLSLVSFSGCSKAKDPKTSFQEYIGYLQKSDYSSMYKLISSDTKKNVDEKYFVDRYKNVYGTAKVSKISITPEYPEKLKEDSGKVHFPAEITLETPIGIKKFTYEVNLTKEKQGKTNEWFLNWDEKMLLPELDKGEGVKYEKKLGKRGEITDRNNQGLAVNSEANIIQVVPKEIEADRANTISQLAAILGVGTDEIESKLKGKYETEHPDQAVNIMYVSRNEMDKILKARDTLKGVKTPKANSLIREYPLKEAAAQLTGYVDTINKEELDKYKDQGYDSNDIIGKTGLESFFEKRLRGEVGGTLYTSDDKGNKKDIILEKAPVNGENIKLTIDAKLQNSIYGQLSGNTGTAVAVQPKTGEVLAMVSTPSFNPNTLANEISNKYYLSLENDAGKPLLARFAGNVVPGSTFKPITAAIGLKTGKLDPSKELNITGSEWQKDSSWGTYKIKRVHADDTSVNLLDAFVTSDNIYFARTALDIQKDNFLNGAKEFGIGEKISFPYTMAPSQIGKLDKDVELADSGYGQDKVLMNPLHMAMIYTSFVNDGNILNPILDMKDKADTPKVWKSNVFSKDIADTITKDLIQVVERGTGKDAKIPGLNLAGKTGTAEVNKVEQNTKGKENGWFAAYNTDDPKLTVVMMIEDTQDKGGSGYVVPKVKNVIQSYLK